MKYIPLKRAAEECVKALDVFLTGNQYAGVDGEAIMKEIRDILRSGLKNEAARREKLKDE